MQPYRRTLRSEAMRKFSACDLSNIRSHPLCTLSAFCEKGDPAEVRPVTSPVGHAAPVVNARGDEHDTVADTIHGPNGCAITDMPGQDGSLSSAEDCALLCTGDDTDHARNLQHASRVLCHPDHAITEQ